MPKTKRQIEPAMFDVRPVTETGDLDVQKIKNLRKVVKIERKKPSIAFRREGPANNLFYDVKSPSVAAVDNSYLEKSWEKEVKKKNKYQVPVAAEFTDNVQNVRVEFGKKEDFSKEYQENYSPQFFPETEIAIQEKKDDLTRDPFGQIDYFSKFEEKLPKSQERKREDKKIRRFLNDSCFSPTFGQSLSFGNKFFSFAVASTIILLIFFSLNIFSRGIKVKGLALADSQKAYANLVQAKSAIEQHDFQGASSDFQAAYTEFNDISQELNGFGQIIIETSKYLPFLSKLSSGSHLAEAGKDIAQVGVKVADISQILNQVKNPLAGDNANQISFLKIFQDTDKNLKEASLLLADTEKQLEEVNVDDLPKEYREKLVEMKNKLPQVNSAMQGFLADSAVFTDILGGNGPRKYLILFQNNQEMRATGGFIGTYAIVDIFNGHIRKFFVDGIFNPDGQFNDRIVPPAPIQKISANWSLHDSNWFPDFPVSAEKSILFYEKTGGPTVDGVITITPVVLQKLLAITGPIEMPEYDVTIDKDNFMEKIQYEVEVNYDKELNQPKKILADLTPKILDKLFNAQNLSDMAKTMAILTESLDEKHILIYSRNYDIQKVLSQRSWSGEILDTQRDYLSVINTNINGYKTDGVIEEKISHTSEIQTDGSIVNTVTITRHHMGGDTPMEWWNKVNADYMRVYVPKGSQLISVSGQTREVNSPPLDYDKLGYKRDPQVRMEEDSMTVDENSGTQVYDDANKTVFANWVYVSPKETAQVTYSYLLPFKLETNLTSQSVATYSLLAQKQSGSLGSQFTSQIIYPKIYSILWKYPENNITEISNLSEDKHGIMVNSDLKTDKFVGVAFRR